MTRPKLLRQAEEPQKGCGPAAAPPLPAEPAASPLARLLFSWVSPLLRTGARRALVESDLLPLNPEEESGHCERTLRAAWSEAGTGRTSVFKALARTHRSAFLLAVAFGVAYSIASLAAPYFPRDLL